MKEPTLIKEFKKVRQETINLVETIPIDHIDIIPEGFNNSIRWNLGHILVAWDHAIFPKLHQHWRVPEHYHFIFPKGTSPRIWKSKPPEYMEIINHLKDQVIEISEASHNKLNELLPEPFIRIKKISGMFRFMIREEIHHQNCINRIIEAIVKATQVAQ